MSNPILVETVWADEGGVQISIEDLGRGSMRMCITGPGSSATATIASFRVPRLALALADICGLELVERTAKKSEASPGIDSGSFVELEDDTGAGIGIREWVQRGTYWELRVPDPRAEYERGREIGEVRGFERGQTSGFDIGYERGLQAALEGRNKCWTECGCADRPATSPNSDTVSEATWRYIRQEMVREIAARLRGMEEDRLMRDVPVDGVSWKGLRLGSAAAWIRKEYLREEEDTNGD